MTSDAGANGTDTPSCRDCGTPAAPGARFCRACGVALTSAVVRPEPPDDAPVPDPEGGEVRGPIDSVTTGEFELDPITRAAGVPPGQGSERLRTCPNCGGPNSPHRELCGRCGADLETGAVPPRADGRVQATPRQPGAQDAPMRRWLGPALLVLLALAVLVGGLGLAGLGPFGDAVDEVPPARFDAATYTGEPTRLTVAEIATLTTLPPQGGVTYEASQMVDDDPSTAWNSDGSVADADVRDGVGERIELVLEEPAWIDRVVVRNGDQRDADTYAANARIQRARVTLDGGIVLLINLLDEGLAAQAVELTEPVLTTGLSIEVLDTFPGDTHPDLAVSDLELQGWSAGGEDVEVARQRADGQPATAQPAD